MKNTKQVGSYFVEVIDSELTVYRHGAVVLTGTVADGTIVEVTFGDEIPAGVEDAVEAMCSEVAP
jgi:hypothetical protein